MSTLGKISAVGMLLAFPLQAFAVPPAADAAKAPAARKMIKDANGDDKISREEFLADTAKKFAEKDADKDGFLTRDEIKKAKAQKPATAKKAGK